MPDLLTNLKIIGMQKPGGIPIGIPVIFEAMFNPNSYTVNHTMNYDAKPAPGNAGTDPGFKEAEPETFTIEFMIDGTGVSKPQIPVPVQVALFNTVTRKVDGETHRPNYLIVQWGTFIRDCVLKSSAITYTLFSAEGIPMRAKVSATFIERKDSELNAIASMFSSPDLTHIVEVKQGDILPLIVYKTYRNQKYYLQVARFNKLKNFRKLEAGSKLNLPPLA
jgi:contractile injection system tube protein